MCMKYVYEGCVCNMHSKLLCSHTRVRTSLPLHAFQRQQKKQTPCTDMPIPDAVASSSIHCAGIQGLDPLHDHLLLQWLLYIPPAPGAPGGGGGGDGAPGGGGGSSSSSTESSPMHAAPPPNTLWLEIPGQPHQQTDNAWLPGEGGVVFLPPHTGAPVPDDAYDNAHTQDPVCMNIHICIYVHMKLHMLLLTRTDVRVAAHIHNCHVHMYTTVMRSPKHHENVNCHTISQSQFHNHNSRWPPAVTLPPHALHNTYACSYMWALGLTTTASHSKNKKRLP